jgi:hypothetical protein
MESFQMNNENPLNLRSAFLVHTALIAVFLFVVSLAPLANRLYKLTLNSAPATFQFSSPMVQ